MFKVWYHSKQGKGESFQTRTNLVDSLPNYLTKYSYGFGWFDETILQHSFWQLVSEWDCPMLKIPFCPEGQKGLPKYEMFFSNLAKLRGSVAHLFSLQFYASFCTRWLSTPLR